MASTDRPAVLKAFEDRLDHPEAHDAGHLIYSYLSMKCPMTDLAKGKEVYAQRQPVEGKYRDKALAVVKADKDYRYGYLVPWLVTGPATGTPDDLFLVEYLLRGPANTEWLVRSTGAMDRVSLPREFEPTLDRLLGIRDWSITGSAIRQLVRMNPEKYLPILRADKAGGAKRFPPDAYKLLDAAGATTAPAAPQTAPATAR